jgi:hypothetical protein
VLRLLVPAAILSWMGLYVHWSGWRVALVRSLLTCATAVVVITECLSALGGLDRSGVAICWSVLLGLPLVFGLIKPAIPRPDRFVVAGVFTITLMCGLIAWTAMASPPNSADAMAYHMPRIVYWVQNKSVAFFPTTYLNQIMMQPVTEYIGLHLYLLSGGDGLINLVQVAGYLGGIVAVSSIAGLLGATPRVQTVAALFCATLPNAILQASGAKNDALLAFWLASMVMCAGRWIRSRSSADLVFTALALGLALGTKGTAYLFAPPFLLAIAMAVGRPKLRDLSVAAFALIGGVLLINTPQYLRNIDLSGSILGTSSAQGDGVYRWRNETLGWKATVSNVLRNASEQLGGRSETWNQSVYRNVLRAHRWLGLDPQDPNTTWRYAEFVPPVNANHEANANNRWHLLILAAAIAIAFWRRDKRWLLYATGPFVGFLAFCFYLKWQPYFSRLEMPLFVIAAPLGAFAIASLRPAVLQIALCLILVSNARLAMLQNWTRPLTGPNALNTRPRPLNYFNDMVQFHNNADSYLKTIEQVAASGCTLVGVDINQNHLEYPLQALLLQRNPSIRFMHVGVENASAKYASGERPCAVVCPDCAGMERKVAQYSEIGAPETVGRFLIFIRHTSPSPDRAMPSAHASE